MYNLENVKESLMMDAAFVEKLEKITSVEDLRSLCREAGIDLDEENSKTGEEFIGDNGEIDDKALENVCGGTFCNVPAVMMMNNLLFTVK